MRTSTLISLPLLLAASGCVVLSPPSERPSGAHGERDSAGSRDSGFGDSGLEDSGLDEEDPDTERGEKPGCWLSSTEVVRGHGLRADCEGERTWVVFTDLAGDSVTERFDKSWLVLDDIALEARPGTEILVRTERDGVFGSFAVEVLPTELPDTARCVGPAGAWVEWRTERPRGQDFGVVALSLGLSQDREVRDQVLARSVGVDSGATLRLVKGGRFVELRAWDAEGESLAELPVTGPGRGFGVVQLQITPESTELRSDGFWSETRKGRVLADLGPWELSQAAGSCLTQVGEPARDEWVSLADLESGKPWSSADYRWVLSFTSRDPDSEVGRDLEAPRCVNETKDIGYCADLNTLRHSWAMP